MQPCRGKRAVTLENGLRRLKRVFRTVVYYGFSRVEKHLKFERFHHRAQQTLPGQTANMQTYRTLKPTQIISLFRPKRLQQLKSSVVDYWYYKPAC